MIRKIGHNKYEIDEITDLLTFKYKIMSYELTGKLIKRSNTEQVSDKFKKRDFVVETSETNGENTYTQQIIFQLVQDKCDLINGFEKDDEIKVYFNIKGRGWEKEGQTRYFNNLEAWKIEKLSGAVETVTETVSVQNTPDDDLPF